LKGLCSKRQILFLGIEYVEFVRLHGKPIFLRASINLGIGEANLNTVRNALKIVVKARIKDIFQSL
jgi:hypothetical protein